MSPDQFKGLQPGDLVRHKGNPCAAIVHANFGDRVTAVRVFDLTNPSEWDAVNPDGSVIDPAAPPPAEERLPFTAWETTTFAVGDIIEVREKDGYEHPMKVGSPQWRTALQDLGPRMPVRAATAEQRAGWGQ